MAGFTFDGPGINNKMGTVVTTLMEAFDDAQRLKVRLIDDFAAAGNDTAQRAALVAATGLTDTDAQALRAVVTALDLLARVAHGQAAQSPASDFFFDARKLRGVN